MTQTTAPRSLWQGGAPAPAKHVRRASNSLRQPALMAFFAFEVICLTVLQKFAFPVNLGGAGGPVQVALPLTYAALFVLLFFVKFSVDRQRVVLLTGALIFAFVTIAMVPGTYSTNSVMLMVLIYLPFILYIEVSEATYHKLIKIYLNAMIIFGAIAMLEQVAQLIWSWEVWPNLDYIIPSNFQMEGFVYIQPFQYGSHFMKPNGIFFLEVSYLSQWTAIALALELVYFRRTWRMSFYAVVLLSCLAGTGLLLLLVCAPVLLSRVSKRSLAVVGVVFLVCVITAISINWVQNVQHRFT